MLSQTTGRFLIKERVFKGERKRERERKKAPLRNTYTTIRDRINDKQKQTKKYILSLYIMLINSFSNS